MKLKNMERLKESSSGQVFHRGELGTSLDEYRHVKLFRHINDQYDFRINNRLLIEKIICPRRDKIIMDSLLNASPKIMLKRKKIRMINDKSFFNGRKNKDIENKENNSKIKKEHSQYIQRKVHAASNSKLKTLRTDTVGEENNSFQNSIPIFKEDYAESKIMETRDSSLRNNFVGKIVRNVARANKYSGNTRNITYNSSGIEKCAQVFINYDKVRVFNGHAKSEFLQSQNKKRIKRVFRPSCKERDENKQEFMQDFCEENNDPKIIKMYKRSSRG